MTSPALLTDSVTQLLRLKVMKAAADGSVYMSWEQLREIESAFATLEQRVEADSKDAARYRWMRASGGLRFPTCIGELVPGYDFEAGIDARIAAESQSALPKEPR